MKVLHCITCIDDAGGAEKLMETLLPGLKDAGCDVSCIVLNGLETKNKQTLLAHGIPVYEIGHDTHYYSLWKWLKLIPYMRQFDIVHAHNTPAVLAVAIGSLFTKAKIVMTMHSTQNRMRGHWLLKHLSHAVLERFSYIICCSQAAEDNIKKAYHFRHPKILKVNNGVNLLNIINAQPLTEMVSKPWKKIVMVAWFRPEKRHETLIEAMRYLPDDFHVYFVGGGPEKEKCEQMATDLGIVERAHFLGLRTDVPQIVKAADYLVLCSHYEGLSLTSVEGMAARKPFLASNVGGLRQIVGGAGVLFPEGDAKKLAEEILNLDQHPDIYNKVAQQCFERAQQYDMSKMVEGYMNVYRELGD